MAYGVTAQGFVIKPAAVIKAELEDRIRADFGGGVNVEPSSVFGQIIAHMTDRLSDMWELSQAAYNARYPDSATAAELDNVAALTGTVRRPATFSTLSGVILTGTPGSTITAGKQASVAGAGTKFNLDADGTLASVTARQQNHLYAAGSLASGSGAVWRTAAGGTTANVVLVLSGTADIIDGGVTWHRIGDGTGQVTRTFTAALPGPMTAPAGTLTKIETPASGWQGVYNPADAVIGSAVESDAALRLRRELELGNQGSTEIDKLRGKLLEVAGVTSAYVYENVTDTTDGFGLPGHTIECVVIGGVDADIGLCIFENKAGGINTYGTNASAVIMDAEGNAHTILFTRPSVIPVYLSYTLTSDATYSGNAAVKAAIAAFGDTSYHVGSTVIASALRAQPFSTKTYVDGVLPPTGVLDVTAFTLGLAPAPVGTSNLTFTRRQIPDLDTSRILINGA